MKKHDGDINHDTGAPRSSKYGVYPVFLVKETQVIPRLNNKSKTFLIEQKKFEDLGFKLLSDGYTSKRKMPNIILPKKKE